MLLISGATSKDFYKGIRAKAYCRSIALNEYTEQNGRKSVHGMLLVRHR